MHPRPLARIALMLLPALLLAGPGLAQEQAQEQAQESSGTPQDGPDRSEQAPNIYPNLAAALIEMGAPVVDLRRPEEIEDTGRIEGAENILHTEIDEIAELIGEDTDRAVILYCGSGRRAARAIEALRERGFSGLVNAGGYSDLRSAIDGG